MQKTVTDQMNHTVVVPNRPQRIISLVPSQTEFLFYLGLEKEVVGITKFCVHPPEQFKNKPRIGGTKQYDFEKIKALQPDLIIGNKEENDQTQIEELAKEYPVWMSDIVTLEDALDMMNQLGEIVGKPTQALALTKNIRQDFEQFRQVARPSERPPRVAYLIWQKPYMVAADQTFINEMLRMANFENIFANRVRYPQITAEELAEAKPDTILLSSEPFPFKEKHVREMQSICPAAKVEIVDGELFSWYGNRLLLAAPYFEKLRLKLKLDSTKKLSKN